MAGHKDISRVSRLEVVELGRRRRWSDDEKIRIVEESYEPPWYRAYFRSRVAPSLARQPDAETVLSLLPGWFAHQNEVHPHHGLGYRSPREFIRANLTT